MNLYLYVGANPLLLIDPLGLFSDPPSDPYNVHGASHQDIPVYGRPYVYRHFYDNDGNYVNTIKYYPNNPALAAAAAKRAADRTLSNTLNTGARHAQTAATAALIIGAVAIPDPTDAALLAGGLGLKAVMRGTATVVRGMRIADSSIEAGLKVRSLTRSNFRHNLKVATGRLPDGHHAHHVFPHTFRERFADIFEGSGLSIHDPRFGAWIDAATHRARSREYQNAWDKWLRNNEHATLEDTLCEAKRLMGEIFGITDFRF